MEQLYQRLVRGFPGAAYRCLHDADWTLEFISDGVSALLGYSPAELVVEKLVAISDLVHEDDLAKVSLEVERAITEKRPFAMVYRMKTRDGRVRWISEVGHGVIDERGDLEALEGFLSDITGEVEARQRNEASERRDSLTRMAAGVAHDFNNLLSGMLTAVQLTREVGDDEAALKEELDTVEHLIGRATALTKQLLQFGRPQVSDNVPLDVAGIVRDYLPILSRLLGSEYQLDLTSTDSALVCRVDRVHIEQILLNLVTNARDAQPGGGSIELQLALVDNHAELRVRDHGSGIDKATQERIFQPYFTTKEAARGTGLGLATVHGLVQAAGGTTSVSSTLGDGSTFLVRLPLLARTETKTLRTETILLADDEEELRTLLARGLRRFGFTVLEASDGEQALQLSARHKGPLDLVLTDDKMPRVDGIELARRIAVERPGIRTVLFSGGHDRGSPGLFARVLQKPLTPNGVAEQICYVLDEVKVD